MTRTLRQHAIDSPQLQLALVARQEGVERTTKANSGFVLLAREVATAICRRKGTVTADELRAACAAQGITPGHFNAWGAVFAHKSAPFRWTGEWRKSTAEQGRGNLQRVWRLA